MTYEVQQTRWDRIIRRVTGSIGPGSRVSETISELMPVLDVERVPPELLLLGGTILGYGGASVGGVALEIPKIQLFNPAGSGNLVTITSCLVRASLGTLVRFTNESSARPTATTTERFRDSRGGVLAQPVAEVRTESVAGQIPAIGIFRMVANEPYVLKDVDSISILAPGTGFVLAPDIVEISFAVTFFWRERPVEQSELSL